MTSMLYDCVSASSKALIKNICSNTKATGRCFCNSKVYLAVMNDPMDHATGIEKRELEQLKAGNKDPWLLDTVLKRGPGTREQPNMIPSAFDGRIVGCSCKGNRFVNWMWLEKGEPKRCECGYYFQLKEIKPI
ncbi:PREDICTED: cytochrome c oxidase subunit 5B, mitochondrial-like [Rhagoletis zephyria]|uniref:cytochrome c oxidase subunit 5B, mitochondrial-like n=1 Tax=Rhagoletis zephyria TaxID=28612 RepID=UPI0008114B3B|nr:PREDICTED: cytochrome c oxidase subunit 5B, mitochondrial-like [Rhagoletis zephyria]